jgi:peptide-methionine (S)-S-oxide reductase
MLRRMIDMFKRKAATEMDAEHALPGRHEAIAVTPEHVVLGTSIVGPWPEGFETISFGMGCFWGSERIFWQVPGVHTTAVGYQGGYTPNPTYQEVCTTGTGHAEVALVVYDPAATNFEELMEQFWEQHDATTLNRQGNDVGTQYRSAIYTSTPEQKAKAEASRDRYQQKLDDGGFGKITTEIIDVADAGPFYYAEDYHQGYLHKNPGGYCNHGYCQVSYA